MVAPRRPPYRPRPLVQRVLPAGFRLPAPSTHTPALPATAGSSGIGRSAAATDWFPPLIPTASDLSGHRCGLHQMLTLVAYDVTDPKRLHRVAKVCEDWGMRVQYSVFECRLDATRFDAFWSALTAEIEPKFDRLVAYKICANCARDIRAAGTMVHNEQVVAYIC